MNNIFDAHAHYDDEWFNEDRERLFEAMADEGVAGIVSSAVDLSSAEINRAYSEQYSFMYFTAGIHPENLQNIPHNYRERIAELYSHKKCVAIGEIGLDYHWDIPRDLQKNIFIEQLRLADELNAPVVVHDREAHGDVMELLKKYRPKGLVHCFSGSAEMLREVMKIGMYISVGGVVTFKNARRSVECVKEVPLDRLLLETDAPYLSPVPNRGKRNDSRNIVYTAEKIAQLRDMTTQQILNITAQNARKLYSV